MAVPVWCELDYDDDDPNDPDKGGPYVSMANPEWKGNMIWLHKVETQIDGLSVTDKESDK